MRSRIFFCLWLWQCHDSRSLDRVRVSEQLCLYPGRTSVLYRVDLPTFGSPTMPTLSRLEPAAVASSGQSQLGQEKDMSSFRNGSCSLAYLENLPRHHGPRRSSSTTFFGGIVTRLRHQNNHPEKNGKEEREAGVRPQW